MKFKEFDLRTQVDSVKSKNYYKKLKNKVEINKHDVVFNETYKFILEYSPKVVHKADKNIETMAFNSMTGKEEPLSIHIKKGETISEEQIIVKLNGKDLTYDKDITGYFGPTEVQVSYDHILENILKFIDKYLNI